MRICGSAGARARGRKRLRHTNGGRGIDWRNLRFRAIGSCFGGEAVSDPAPNSFAGLIAKGGEAQASNLICFVHPGKLADCFDALAGIEREPAKDRTISMHRGNSLKPEAFL